MNLTFLDPQSQTRLRTYLSLRILLLLMAISPTTVLGQDMVLVDTKTLRQKQSARYHTIFGTRYKLALIPIIILCAER